MKYELTSETKVAYGKTLYRIKALVDFGSVRAGDLGGWVESVNNLSQEGDAWLFGHAQVSGHARVSGNAKVFGNALVFGNAKVFGNAEVSGHARVSGHALVFDDAQVSGHAWVSGYAWVSGHARVYGNAWVFGNAKVFGNARVFGDALVERSPSCVSRSDGYSFVLVKCVDNTVRICAGCRYFTLEEAWDHWDKTRKGTELGDETFDILNFFENRVKSLGW